MPKLLDLCCGSGGWSWGFLLEGWEVVGLDIEDHPSYPGWRRIADVREPASLAWAAGERPDFVVASPPCPEYSRWGQMCFELNRVPPDTSIWDACVALAASLQRPLLIENVRGAQYFHGAAAAHVGPYYLWGAVPALLPRLSDLGKRPKSTMSSDWKMERARVPVELARCVARFERDHLSSGNCAGLLDKA